MSKEVETMTKKAVKIAGATCVAAGAVALIASGAALRALTEGAQYLKDVAKKILDEEPNQKEVVVDAEAPAEDASADEAPAENSVEVSAEKGQTEVSAPEETN